MNEILLLKKKNVYFISKHNFNVFRLFEHIFIVRNNLPMLFIVKFSY